MAKRERNCRNCRYLKFKKGTDGTGLDYSYICTEDYFEMEPNMIENFSCDKHQFEKSGEA